MISRDIITQGIPYFKKDFKRVHIHIRVSDLEVLKR